MANRAHPFTPRRRAASNYQTVEEQVVQRKATLPGGANTPGGTAQQQSGSGIFELLQAKFGFQDGNVRNQKEHFECWVLNYESRAPPKLTPDSDDAVRQIHARFFKNYTRWCKFLQTKPYLIDANSAPGTAEREVALFLLIWGEAGNLRFMPECLCFLYHSLASKLDGVERLPNVPDGTFLRRVVRPIYLVVAKMRVATTTEKGKRPLDHKNITNYDDVNEFFWSQRCLDFDELNVAEAINLQEHKTFKERRSLVNPVLAFFRIYFFLLVMLHILVVIAYVAYRSDPTDRNGFKFYSKMFSSDVSDIRNHAFCSVFLTVAGLLMLKVVMEVWIGGFQIFSRGLYAAALFLRLVWHTVFFALFAIINTSPYEVLIGSKDMLSMGYILGGAYMAPVVIAAIVQMFFGQWVWNLPFLNAMDGKREQYIGRTMGQSWGSFFLYGLFWLVIFVLKFLFNLQLMIKPLIGPTVEIYDIKVSAKQLKNGIIESEHNIAFLIAMWGPVFLVYIYDSQIWLAIMQSVVGAYIGLRLKIGHSSRIPEFVKRLKAAPALFDSKVVSASARGQLSMNNGDSPLSASGVSPEANTRLRFAVVWNEIISSFRLSDLLDDRETAILQYQIADSGSVEDPVFLIAGQAQTATDIAAKAKTRRLDDAKLMKELEKAGVLGCARNCLDIGFQILRQLLGPKDAEIIAVFQEMLLAGKVTSVVNLIHIPLVRENVVDLLASILDLPEPSVVPVGGTFGLPNDQVVVIVQRVDALLKSIELMLEEEWMAQKIRQSVFAKMTPDLEYQKQQLQVIFADRISQRDSNEGPKSSPSSNESMISLSTRLFFLLTLDAADALPRCHEAQRRMSFFLNSLSMKMPSVKSIASMHSFSVITPYYNESVLYSIEELNGRVNSNPLFKKVEAKGRDLSILKYLITFHSDEWGNFLERVGATSIDEALAETPTQVRLWASMRGQTLARTVHGMMLYEDALKMLRWLEIGSDDNISHLEKIKHMDRIAGLKFSYVTSCQIYSEQLAAGDSRAADIDLLMRKYPNWRVSYMDTIRPPAGSGTEPRYDCVLVKSDGDEIVEVYRYELPGNPMVGEGKPENQNIALPFTRGEYVQTIDMNQEHYFEEALKIPNFLATATENGQNVTIIGMKEHIFTGRASSLAHFMTLQELVFVSLTQRVMAYPLCTRMHYGHPDVFEKSFIMTNGGVSKASKGINLSEDVFSGYNACIRGEHVSHIEFMQCGKGRDVTLSQINAFEAKLANGSAESSLSRESHRMGSGMDFFRLNSMFYGHMGFYICNALTVLCVFVYAYAKVYIALHEEIQVNAIMKTGGVDDLATVMNTQFIFQFGMLMTIPLIATLLVEFGWRQASVNFVEMVVTLGPLFYIFETGTKAHFYDVALMRGGSKYRGTGRGFAIIRETMVNFYKEYAASHYRKAMELLGLMIIFGVYGNFNIGTGARNEYCATADFDCDASPDLIPQNITLLNAYSSKGQDYGIASFAVWLLGTCWLLAPFFFNTDGMDFAKTRVDVGNWLNWMMASPGHDDEALPNGATRAAKSDTWHDFFTYESDLMTNVQWTARVGYFIRELRHPLTMYYVFIVSFDLEDMGLLGGCIGGIAVLLWLGSFVGGFALRNKANVVRGVLYMVIIVGGIGVGPFIVGSTQDWSGSKSFSLTVGIFTGLYTILQFLLILHGAMRIPVARLGLVVELAFLFDMVVGLFLIVPLLVLSAFPFMRTIQTRMMYNGGFSRALSSGNEFAASLSVVVGALGGWSYGWLTCLIYSLGYVNSVDDHFINESFIYYVNTALGGDFETESLKGFAGLAAAVGALAGAMCSHVIGRRLAIVVSCVVTFAGVGLVWVESSSMILIGCCVAAAGIAMLSVVSVTYNFEINMVGWKGKGVLMFLFTSSLGFFVEALVLDSINAKAMSKNWSNKPTHDWQWQFVFGVIPLIILVPSMFFLPESPVWLFRHRDQKSAEMMLVRLRQRHDVIEEFTELKESFVNKGSRVNIPFRIAVVCLLQAAFGILNSNALLRRVAVQANPSLPGAQTSRWLVYFGLMTFVGVILSLMTVDNLRRKTIFKDILPFSAILSVACGAIGGSSTNTNVIVDVALFVLFASSALSLTCATWLTAVEVFPSYQNGRYVALSFFVYYAVQAGISFAQPGFAISHFVFAALCGLLTVIMFAFCASTNNGAIELKREKKMRKEEESHAADERARYASRASRSQSFLRSRSQVRHSSHYALRTPQEGNYQNFESPAAVGQPVNRRSVNGSTLQ
ncbi:Callose synthase 5, partial [Globisporangium splendens]